MILINPQKTLPISVTGNKCALKCKHCNARYLNHMVDIHELNHEIAKKYTSFLVSGGSDKNGVIPFKKEHFHILSNYKQKKNFHTGLINDVEMAKDISYISDSVSLDIVYDNKIIKYVYNLDKNKEDYRKSLELFLRFTKNVFPHITVGLNGGKLSHEFSSIDMLSQYEELEAVVFLVLIPTKNTFFENSPLTPLNDIKRVIEYARLKLKSKIILGCMKPHGKYGEKIDLEVKELVDAIVKPSKKLGTINNYECCVLSYLREGGAKYYG